MTLENQVGSYQILEVIGEGAIGRTYKAKHVITGGLACIKHCLKISPMHEEILKKEARLLETLSHEAIPAFRDLIKLPDGSFALVMNYFEGFTLAQQIERHGVLRSVDIAWIIERLLNALFYSYYKGVVHGDIKPQNLILRGNEHYVGLVDWGIAAVKPKANSISTGFTAIFAPPEETLAMTILPESDLFSLGLVMIYAITGNLVAVRQRAIPLDTPLPMANFIKRLIIRDIAFRPKWEEENLFETFKQIRLGVFGKAHSDMEPLPGWTKKEAAR